MNGASHSRLLLEPGSFDHETTTFEWQGADMTVDTNPSTGTISVDGEIKAWKVAASDMVADFSAISITADQHRSDFGFNVGSVEMNMGPISLVEDGAELSIESLSLSAESSINDDRMDGHSVVVIDTVNIPTVGTIDIAMDMAMERVDAASIAVIGKAIQEAQSAPDPEAALANLYPDIQEETETLFHKGFSVRMDKFDVALAQGVVSTKFNLDVPESAADTDFSWSTVLLTMSASIDLRIPGTIFEMAAMMNDQAGSLVAMGVLVPDGEDFVMDAEYAQGLINVNGVPLPVPIPGL